MNYQRNRTLQEHDTSLTPAETLAAARQFFTRQNSIYTAFIEQASPTHISMRGQGGEELIIGVRERPGGTVVTGSSYLYDQQIARFFSTLPPAPPAPALPEQTGDEAAAVGAGDGGAA